MSNDTTNSTVATRWRLDPVQSTAEFRVPNLLGSGKVKGTFDRLHGWLEIGGDGRRRLELTIDADSLNTGNDKRDEHLKSADFFDTQRHPDVRFISTRGQRSGRRPAPGAGRVARGRQPRRARPRADGAGER